MKEPHLSSMRRWMYSWRAKAWSISTKPLTIFEVTGFTNNTADRQINRRFDWLLLSIFASQVARYAGQTSLDLNIWPPLDNGSCRAVPIVNLVESCYWKAYVFLWSATVAFRFLMYTRAMYDSLVISFLVVRSCPIFYESNKWSLTYCMVLKNIVLCFNACYVFGEGLIIVSFGFLRTGLFLGASCCICIDSWWRDEWWTQYTSRWLSKLDVVEYTLRIV